MPREEGPKAVTRESKGTDFCLRSARETITGAAVGGDMVMVVVVVVIVGGMEREVKVKRRS